MIDDECEAYILHGWSNVMHDYNTKLVLGFSYNTLA